MSLRPSARSRAKARAKLDEPGRAAWKLPLYGRCLGCGRRGPLMRHHVVLEQHVRREGGDPWDQDNAMPLGVFCRCHDDHHAPNGRKRLSRTKIPVKAERFAVRLMGEDRAREYLARYYAP